MAKTKKLGRPSKYLKKYDEMLLKHMSQGFSYESFAGSIGVCRDTLYEWESKHPNFSDTKKRAIDACLFPCPCPGVSLSGHITTTLPFKGAEYSGFHFPAPIGDVVAA